jgi:hypothetical protein
MNGPHRHLFYCARLESDALSPRVTAYHSQDNDDTPKTGKRRDLGGNLFTPEDKQEQAEHGSIKITRNNNNNNNNNNNKSVALQALTNLGRLSSRR